MASTCTRFFCVHVQVEAKKLYVVTNSGSSAYKRELKVIRTCSGKRGLAWTSVNALELARSNLHVYKVHH